MGTLFNLGGHVIFGSFPGCFKRRTTQRAKVASLTIFSSFKRRSMNSATVLLTVQRAGVKIEMSLLATNLGKIWRLEAPGVLDMLRCKDRRRHWCIGGRGMSPFFIRALLFLPEGSQVACVLRGGAWGIGEPQNPSGIRDPVLKFDLVCSFFFVCYTPMLTAALSIIAKS